MPTVGAEIRAQRLRLGLTLQAIADMVGCTKGYLSAIENDRREKPPSPELLSRIEAALRLPAGSLVFVGGLQVVPDTVKRHYMALEQDRGAVRRLLRLIKDGTSVSGGRALDDLYKSGELARLVEHFEGADGRGGGGAAGGLRDVARHHGEAGGHNESDAADEDGEPGVPSPVRPARAFLPLQVPLINKVAAGYPTEFTDLGYPARIADEYVSVPDVHDPDAFAARVIGASMEPEYREGDIVVFSPRAATVNGSDCFVRLERNSETTFKRVYFEGDEAASGSAGSAGGSVDSAKPARGVRAAAKAGLAGPEAVAMLGAAGGSERVFRIRLQPLNPAFAPRVVEREEVAGMYAAVYVVRPLTRA